MFTNHGLLIMNHTLITEYIIRKLKTHNFSVDMDTGEVYKPVLTEEQKAECKAFCESSEGAAILLRHERNKRLQLCDWTQGADVPDKIKGPWATYRQTLRDLPANTSDPRNPIWPTKPE